MFRLPSELLPAAVLVLALAPLPLHATTIFSENFDTTAAVLGVTTAGGFTAINGTNVDVVGSGDSFGALCAGPESGNCVDLGGSNGNAVGQLALTTPIANGTYLLSFDLIGSGRGTTTTTQVMFGDYLQTFVLGSGDLTSGIVLNHLVTVTNGSPNLEFIDLSENNNIGAVLDNVSVTTAVTPEPSSLILLGTGALGALGAIRRRMAA